MILRAILRGLAAYLMLHAIPVVTSLPPCILPKPITVSFRHSA